MHNIKHYYFCTMIPKYINILTDFGFNLIFADENNKDLLIDFLNAVLSSLKIHIQDIRYKIRYKNTEFNGEHDEEEKVIIDLYGVNEVGDDFLLEVVKQKYFNQKIFYYISRFVQEEGTLDFNRYCNLKGIYSIGILEFEAHHTKSVLEDFFILNEKNHQPFLDDFAILIIDLSKFNKKEDELSSNFDKWAYIFKNLDKLNEIPEQFENELFKKLFKITEFSALRKEQQKEYLKSLKRYYDLQNAMNYARKVGFEKGYHMAELKYKE